MGMKQRVGRVGVSAVLSVLVVAMAVRAEAADPPPRGAGARGAAVSSPLRPTDAEGISVVSPVRTAGPMVVDGRLSEATWTEAEALTQLRQRNPNEGQRETERTEIRVAYDNDALYVGAGMYDRQPAQIVRQLSRRDADAESDSITIYLDPQHDHRTGVMLRVSAAGSLADALIFDDSSQDVAWDGVWDAAVSATTTGGRPNCAFRSRSCASRRARARRGG